MEIDNCVVRCFYDELIICEKELLLLPDCNSDCVQCLHERVVHLRKELLHLRIALKEGEKDGL